MALLSRLIYRALVWKERQRALRGKGLPDQRKASHLATGRRGETLAYWYLRQAGYTIVARNRPRHASAGELDLVAWDGPVLAFVEVKTRTSLEAGPPELAVKRKQRERLVRAAKQYLRKRARGPATFRFDIVSVLWDEQAGFRVHLIKDAFQG